MLKPVKTVWRQKSAGSFVIIASRYNERYVNAMLAAAKAELTRAGATVRVIRVPGAFEIPVAAAHVARARRPAAVICLGCVIRGGTPHFEYICQAAAHGVTRAALDTGVPMAFGVLTTDSVEQAVERAGPGPANKGYEAAQAAIEMATLARALQGSE